MNSDSNLGTSQLYGDRVHGPFDPARGLRFDPAKGLLDPYARGVVVPPDYSRATAAQPRNNAAATMKTVVVNASAYDWDGDTPLRPSSAQTIISKCTCAASRGTPTRVSRKPSAAPTPA